MLPLLFLFYSTIASKTLIYAAIVSEGTPEIPDVVVEWHPYKPKYFGVIGGGKTFDGTSHAFIDVPLDYWHDYCEPGRTLQIRVRRIERGAKPVKHVWFIPGGPGQHSNDMEWILYWGGDRLPPNTWLYFMDHRGTGKSGKIASSKQQDECFEDFGECVRKLPFPVQVLSIHNAALDLITITQALQKATQEQQWFVTGSSYGGMLAAYILGFAPSGMFAGFLMNSMMPDFRQDRFRHLDIRDNLVQSCAADSYCRSEIDPQSIQTILSDFLKTDNQCLHEIADILGGFKVPGFAERSEKIRLFLRRLNYYYGGEIIFTLVAFLKQGTACSNLYRFRVLSRRLFQQFFRSIEENESQSLKSKMQQTLHRIINGSETIGTVADNCSTWTEDANAWHSPCHFVTGNLNKSLAPFFYRPRIPPPVTRQAGYATRVVIAASRLDCSTLHDVAKSYYDGLAEVEEKFFVSIDSTSHSGLLASECFSEVTNYLFEGTLQSKKTAEACLSEKEKQPKTCWRDAFYVVHATMHYFWPLSRFHPIVNYALTVSFGALVPAVHFLQIYHR